MKKNIYALIVCCLRVIPVIVCLCLTGYANKIKAITVPGGEHVMLDGRLEPGEWADAREIAVSKADRVYLKRRGEFLYIAVKVGTPQIFGVDLYFETENKPETLNLHASAKLGERLGRDVEKLEWNWWNNRDWTASVGRGDDFQARKFLPDEAKEFQIRLTKLAAKKLFLTIDIQTREGTRNLPENGLERKTRRWLYLKL